MGVSSENGSGGPQTQVEPPGMGRLGTFLSARQDPPSGGPPLPCIELHDRNHNLCLLEAEDLIHMVRRLLSRSACWLPDPHLLRSCLRRPDQNSRVPRTTAPVAQDCTKTTPATVPGQLPGRGHPRVLALANRWVLDPHSRRYGPVASSTVRIPSCWPAREGSVWNSAQPFAGPSLLIVMSQLGASRT